MRYGAGMISDNNRKSCCECGSKINKGEYCWQVQSRQDHDGSRHLCKSCTSRLTEAEFSRVVGNRIGVGILENKCWCCRCKAPLERGTWAAHVRIRPEGTILVRGAVKSVSRKLRVCIDCLSEIKYELKVSEEGLDTVDAVRHLNSNSIFLRFKAKEALDGRGGSIEQ